MAKRKSKAGIKPSKRTLIIALSILIIVLLAAIIFLKSKDTAPKYSANVTDPVEQNGELVAFKYNNFQFEKREGMWFTQIQQGSQPYIIAFLYGPINVENITIEYKENLFPALTTPKSKVYLTFDHDGTNSSYIATASINLITNMRTVYGIDAERACTKNSTNCAGAPVVTCESHKNNAVIQFIESKETRILYEDNCLTIWAERDNFIKAVEKIILDWYGVV